MPIFRVRMNHIFESTHYVAAYDMDDAHGIAKEFYFEKLDIDNAIDFYKSRVVEIIPEYKED